MSKVIFISKGPLKNTTKIRIRPSRSGRHRLQGGAFHTVLTHRRKHNAQLQVVLQNAGRDRAGIAHIFLAADNEERVLEQFEDGGPLSWIVAETELGKPLTFVAQRLGDCWGFSHAHFEHDLVVGVVLCPWSLWKVAKSVMVSRR